VVLVHGEDLRALGLRDGQRVDVTSHFGAESRTLRDFRVLAYDVARGCAAAYFPEANPLVPIGQFAERSFTPAYKSVVVSLAPTA
jgi:anaerobic selenocysteine-containing dehydrogenase